MQLDERFETMMKGRLDDSRYEVYKRALDANPTVSVRHNPFKKDKVLELSCTVLSSTDDSVEWCKEGYYLSERPDFITDPLLHGGAYYVQDAASMFVDQIVRQYIKEPVNMLDLCAAPGGKSTVLRAALPQGSLLICNEPVRQRAMVLMENMQKQGHPDVIVTNDMPRDFQRCDMYFDAILADVPCSGEGMFRKDPNAITEWSPENVNNSAKLQREIIADIWQQLNPGGLLIYSTCTFNNMEDEDNVRWICENLGASVLPVDIKPEWNIINPSETLPCYLFVPGFTRGEGQFMAVLRKDGNGHTSGTMRRSQKKNENILDLSYLLSKDTEWMFTKNNKGIISAIPQRWWHLYQRIEKNLRIVSVGITLGEIKGKDLVPDEALALSIELNRAVFPTVELSYDDAIKYLHRDNINLPTDTPRGLVIVKYRNLPLGFVKNIGNRCNNLYPKEWRILRL